MTLEEMARVLKDVTFRHWAFVLVKDGERALLQVRFAAGGEIQHGRKWLLSPHMTKSELEQTALMAVLAAQEHETREDFRYRGQPIFQPHYDVDALLELNLARRTDERRTA